MSNLIVSAGLLIGFFCNFILVWGLPHSMGCVYRNLRRTHRGLVVIYLATFVLMTYFLSHEVLLASRQSAVLLAYLIIGSLYFRIGVSLCFGSSNLVYKLGAVATFVCSQCWVVLHLPLVELVWLPWVAGQLAVRVSKHNVLSVLLVERNYFWMELITILQVYLVVVLRLS